MCEEHDECKRSRYPGDRWVDEDTDKDEELSWASMVGWCIYGRFVCYVSSSFMHYTWHVHILMFSNVKCKQMTPRQWSWSLTTAKCVVDDTRSRIRMKPYTSHALSTNSPKLPKPPVGPRKSQKVDVSASPLPAASPTCSRVCTALHAPRERVKLTQHIIRKITIPRNRCYRCHSSLLLDRSHGCWWGFSGNYSQVLINLR